MNEAINLGRSLKLDVLDEDFDVLPSWDENAGNGYFGRRGNGHLGIFNDLASKIVM
jgi:hypothetical protein